MTTYAADPYKAEMPAQEQGPPGFVKSKAGGWVPPDHPEAAGQVGPAPVAGGAVPLPGAPQAQAQGAGPEMKVQGPGLQTSPQSKFADIYKQAFGTDATQEQLDFFVSQDPVAMEAHIRGMGAQQNPGQQPPAQQGPPPPTPDPFQGNGFWTGQQWVPKDHPLAKQAAPRPDSFAPGGSGDPNAAPPPTQFTSTPNMQDVQRKAILSEIEKAQQPVSVNDANIKAQLDPFMASLDRQRRTAENEAAERNSTMGLKSSGAADVERRMIQERAGLAGVEKGASLVGQELQAKRDQLKNYMDLNARTIDADQARMLQKQLAELDAQIRREGLALQGELGRRDLDLRADLGGKGLQNDIMRMLLQNRQFGDDLGFRIGSKEADINRDALLAAMGMG